MPRPEYHVFVCGQQRPPGHPRGSCGEHGASQVIQQLNQAIMDKRLMQRVSLVVTGCLGPCHAGANVLIYPGGILYTRVQPADAAPIIDKLLAGEVMTERLAPAEVW